MQNARKACGEHDELTQEAQNLHNVVRRLEQELGKPTCPINRDTETYEEQLEVLINGCKKNLNALDQVLTKYNALSEQERSGRQLWQKIRFGNGKMTDMADLRARLMYYTSAMSLFLNMVSLGTMGRVERQLNDAGGDLKEIKKSVNETVAEMMSKSKGPEGSIFTAYADDDQAVWREFRRELVQDGFSSSVITRHKKLIKSYIEELGSRGLLDDRIQDIEAVEQDFKFHRNSNDATEEQDFKSDLAPITEAKEQDPKSDLAPMNEAVEQELESDRSLENTAEEQDLRNDPAPMNEVEKQGLKSDPARTNEAEEQDLGSGSNANDEGEGQTPESYLDPKIETEEQNLKSDAVIEDALKPDLDTRRGLETSLGPQVVEESSVVSNGLTFTESFENLSEIFEHRSKTVDTSRVRRSEVGVSFSRPNSRTNSNANLPSHYGFSEIKDIHLMLVITSRWLDPVDNIETKESRLCSLLTVASASEILEVFVFEGFGILAERADYANYAKWAQYRDQKLPIAYTYMRFKSLKELYQEIDKQWKEQMPTGY